MITCESDYLQNSVVIINYHHTVHIKYLIMEPLKSVR